jgi:hypothetical protein
MGKSKHDWTFAWVVTFICRDYYNINSSSISTGEKMKKTITFLAMFLFTIILATVGVATTYYDQNFNTNICSQLTFERADIDGSAPSWNYNCSTSGGVLHLYTKNTLITGFNLTTPLPDQDFWNRNLTYTIILKKGHQYSDFYIIPLQMSENMVQGKTGQAGPNTVVTNYNFTIPMSASASEIVTPSSSLTNLDNIRTFTYPIKISYPEKYLTTSGSLGYTFTSNLFVTFISQQTHTNLSNACVDDGCVIQLLWGGIDNKLLSYYVNNNLVTTYSYTYSYYSSPNTANIGNSLNNTFGGGIFFSGNDYVDVDIDRIKLEEGNTVGNYYWGSSTAPLVDCNNGLDDDLDGLVDYPEDPSCTNATDTDESPKDASFCEEATCSQADKCIYSMAFDCSDPIAFHGWTTNESFYATLMEAYASKVLLNEYLDPMSSIPLPNGTYVQTDSSVTLYVNYSSNKKDYTQVEHKFVFYMQPNIASNGNMSEWTNITFRGTSGDDFTIGLKPLIVTSIEDEGLSGCKFSFSDRTSMLADITGIGFISGIGKTISSILGLNSVTTCTNSTKSANTWVQIWVEGENIGNAIAYQDGLYRFELLVNTYKPSNVFLKSQYELFYRTPTFTANESIWKYSNQRWNFSTSDQFINSIKIDVSGDPAYDYAQHDSEIYMYLSSVNVNGIFSDNDTSNRCTEWASPYILKEDFNGCLNDCGWNTVPSSLCAYGSLQSTLGDSIAIAKQNDYVDSTISRYVTLSFDITSQGFNLVNGVSFQLYDADAKNFIYLLLNNGILFNRVDGNYEVLSAVYSGLLTNVQIHIDLSEDTFDVYIDGYLISSGNHFTNSVTDINTIGSFYLQSSNYAYLLDNVKMYMTDQTNNELIINPNEKPPVVVDSTKGVCGHVFKITPACEQDSECETGYCTPTGKCSSFDMTYCDENGMTRGNQCILSAYGGCFMSSIGSIILGNFLYVLIFILLLVGVTYLAVMLRSRGK